MYGTLNANMAGAKWQGSILRLTGVSQLATTSAPKLFTALCTITFEMLKGIDCKPAGRPICIIWTASLR